MGVINKFQNKFYSKRSKTKINTFLTIKYLKSDIDEYKKMKTKPILFVRHLSKRYFLKTKPAINNIGFDVFPGEFHAFIGANGAGKTTTIKSLIGAYANWNGTVLIKGIRNDKEEAKKKLGYIPENARFPEQFSSIEYLKWMVMLSGWKEKDAKLFAIKKLKELNMWNLYKKSPNSFSSGQKKKILLAQALIHDPDIIIMDEPTANLDPKARIEFFDLLETLRKKGKAIFVSSHELAELEQYADSVTVLDGGNIVFSGKKKDFVTKIRDKRYYVQVEKNDLLSKYLTSKKIKHYFNEHEDCFVVFFKNNKQIYDLQIYMSKNKQLIQRLAFIQPTLEDMYRKFVVKGSVDTMNINKSNNVELL